MHDVRPLKFHCTKRTCVTWAASPTSAVQRLISWFFRYLGSKVGTTFFGVREIIPASFENLALEHAAIEAVPTIRRSGTGARAKVETVLDSGLHRCGLSAMKRTHRLATWWARAGSITADKGCRCSRLLGISSLRCPRNGRQSPVPRPDGRSRSPSGPSALHRRSRSPRRSTRCAA